MNVKVFDEILERHVRTVLVPQMKSSLNRFMVGAALGSGLVKAEAMADQLKALGIMDQDGEDVDTVKLAEALKGGFDQTPNVTVMGFTFDRDDADQFMRTLNVQAQAGVKESEVVG